MNSLAIKLASRPRETGRVLRLRVQAGQARRAILQDGSLQLPAVIGRSGLVANKREGDGGTPLARMMVLGGFGRAERWPRLALPRWMTVLRPGHDPLPGWCDDPAHRLYNRPCRLPIAASAEQLLRPDALYDAVLVLDWNIHPRKAGHGSAIFLHVMAEDRRATEGCIALAADDLARLLRRTRPGDIIDTRQDCLRTA